MLRVLFLANNIMRSSSFKETLSSFLEINAISMSFELQDRLFEIFKLLLSWSKKINITANTSVHDFILENIIDPALAHQAFVRFVFEQKLTICPSSKSVADVGCGGGFVGFTWHLLNHEIDQLILIDSDRKKINFCKDVIRHLSLQKCVAMNSRVEDIHTLLADLVLTRATWKAEDTRSLCSGLALPGASFLHFCGPSTRINNQLGRIEYNIKPKNLHRYLLFARF